MSLVVNHNLMAANVARNLNSHYANLSNSTQRLSTGLRVNSAADDAAGLAIRELQRADIAALHQGARNANDAISLIQVADGALQIIDEKLVRMKELAEQAATGTYDSTQRLMIESEYQAMASEITRIANATDFNGINLLDGTLESDKHDGTGLTATGKLKVHFGTGNDSAEDYYYIKIGESTAQAFGVGDASTWQDAASRISKTFKETLASKVDEFLKSSEYSEELKNQVKVAAENWDEEFATNILKFSDFSSGDDLSKLYASFKNDSEVSELSPLFEQYILDYDSLNYRDAEKMKYALGRAAMRSLANNSNIATGFGDSVNQYNINANADGILGNINYSAFSADKNGAVISYNPNENRKLVFVPPADYNGITYNANTGENAPLDYPLRFTSPLTLKTLSNSLPGSSGAYTFNTNGDLLSYTDATTGYTTLYNGSKIAGYKDDDGISTYNGDENPISYLETNDNRAIFEGNSEKTSSGTYTVSGGTMYSENGVRRKYTTSTSDVAEFDTSGNMTKLTENSGAISEFDSSGRLIKYTDTSSNIAEYDAYGNLIKYTDSAGAVSEFDASGNLISYTDTTGTAIFNASNEYVSFTTTGGVVLDFSARGTKPTLSSSLGTDATDTIDGVTIPSITDSTYTSLQTAAEAARVNALAVDNVGGSGAAKAIDTLATAVGNTAADPSATGTASTIDAAAVADSSQEESYNRIVEYINASDGSITTFHPNGKISTYTDRETNLTTFRDDGTILSYTDKSGNVTLFDSSEAPIQYTDNSGNKTTISSGLKASYTDVDGNITTFDTSGNYIRYQDVNKNISEYDASTQQLTKFIDSNGNTIILSTPDDFNTAIVSDVNGTVIGTGDLKDAIIRNAQALSTSGKIAAAAASTSADAAVLAVTDSTDGSQVLAAAAKVNAETARDSAIDDAKAASQDFDDATSYITATTNMINDDVVATDSEFYKLTSALNETLASSLLVAAESADKYNFAGFTIATQEDAQKSLAAISDAIEAKDKIRADLGAKQNRLENTISNLNIQAENLQAAESRISDVDVSTEMTEFVRQQILTQSAVAMLSQANSLPQMAMQLIGG